MNPMTEQTPTRRRVLLILAGLLVANFFVSLLLWLGGKEPNGEDVTVRGLIALLMILGIQRLSRRVKVAMWIVFAIAVAGLVWQWSVR